MFIQHAFDRTMNKISELASKDPHQNRLKLIGYEMGAASLESILLIGHTVLFPLILIGKPVCWLMAKKWKRAEAWRDSFPELAQCVIKIVWLVIGLFCTSTYGFIFPGSNVEMHRNNFHLISKPESEKPDAEQQPLDAAAS